jgi:hypothetical protein
MHTITMHTFFAETYNLLYYLSTSIQNSNRPWNYVKIRMQILCYLIINIFIHLSTFSLQRLNIRCNPGDVLASIQILNERHRQAIVRKGFSSIIDMTIDAIGCRTLLCWLMQKLDPRDMTLRIGPDKELKITKQTINLILGLPNSCGGKPLNIDEANAAATLRSSLSISKDEFVISKL